MTHNILIAGFGGQGILFAGKILVYAGLIAGKEVSWLPSYGPEMRGGTCNCSVVISDEPIGSPLVTNPDILIVLNTPSLEKFENTVAEGGIILIDSTMCDTKVTRTDVRVFDLPATALADDNDLRGGANIILLGKLFGETALIDDETFKKAVEKVVPETKPRLRENDMIAMKMGFSYGKTV
jgi:2-oxoglutarate ferredoxin oxidoreductase subunit gamma